MTGDLLKDFISFHMIFYMTGQEKDDLLLQVTACTGLTEYDWIYP